MGTRRGGAEPDGHGLPVQGGHCRRPVDGKIAAMDPSCCNILELGGTRAARRADAFVSISARHFIESQEAEGMTVIGQFRDRRRPDRFVWIRGFSDMENRRAALERFYGGPVWAEHRDEANATMLEFHDVLLLKPARPDLAFQLNVSDRSALGEERPAAVVLAGIHSSSQPAPADTEAVSNLERELRASGVRIDGVFVTEPSPNTYLNCPYAKGRTCWSGSVRWKAVNGGTRWRPRRQSSWSSTHAALAVGPSESLTSGDINGMFARS